ncbi:3-deoxy-D-manno-octulosonic acid transferase [Pusillimonas noertemannii]|uniref:3-deoxy-D-manno-octulosonic acid transferase n=1 Tax=Pusillimonas noertemannii TaxID=305977 RepID=A0A2U1CIP1_9BURK|nr:3-deoxy-D-manno-octulosonic acid transferase [Pusillimonas noertemannii]NYT70697.1 3-deoxy-D-manno-octulosonic acid transferase [Pusillimonas noertemannii]PVY60854.1 3-deoxy-D-manno-octulosonic-acid transferase [Pusillimonas noertemannii]TFL08549.1 3-deoxy-D-manno-octulosonic acid transferase [Pusillimonas noertemannii]
MNRFAYTAGVTLLAPALLIWMGLRARRAGGQWEVMSGPRFGRYAKAAPQRQPVWIHAVSLGETRAAQPLVQALLDEGRVVLLTHMTATGRAEAARMFARAIADGLLVQEWLPYDFPGGVQRFLAHYKPRLGVMIEREIWPNIIATARRMGIPMVLASARFSDNALRQSLRAGRVMREAYESLHAVYAQTLQDAQRLEQAGAVAVRVSGNFKFDVSPPPDEVARGKAFATALPRKMLTIASTREGEDELFINAIAQQLKRGAALGNQLADEVLFCLIPRHPQRFDEAAALLAKAGIPFVRRSQFASGDGTASRNIKACATAAVLLGDSIGEMTRYYAASQVAIVAGSFAPLGGQNLIEACAVGLPVIVGPHTRNFEQAAADAIQEGAALRAPDPDSAVQLALQLLDDPQRLGRMGEAGAYWVKQHAGAVARVLIGLHKLMARQEEQQQHMT